MIVLRNDGPHPVLTEVPADNEAQLQELIKDNPDLLPIDEFGMTGPVMVVGRETTLPSGGVDLVGITRSGELLVVEFKTGPQNTDFRHVLAQLLDYGSDLWGLSYQEFESTVASRYFGGARCQDSRVRGKKSLAEAARATWPDLTDEEEIGLRDQLVQQLTGGSFHYVVVAQRFTSTVERTIEYLNSTMQGARFYAVELVKFSTEDLAAFESRTVVKPERRKVPGGTSNVNEERFLVAIADSRYRDVIRELLEACRGLSLRFEWGAVGTSIRMPTVDRVEPVTIGWLFPGGGRGFMGMSDLNLGFHTTSAGRVPSLAPALDAYIAEVAAIAGTEQLAARNLRAYHLAPRAVIDEWQRITEALANLVRRANAGPGAV